MAYSSLSLAEATGQQDHFLAAAIPLRKRKEVPPPLSNAVKLKKLALKGTAGRMHQKSPFVAPEAEQRNGTTHGKGKSPRKALAQSWGSCKLFVFYGRKAIGGSILRRAQANNMNAEPAY